MSHSEKHLLLLMHRIFFILFLNGQSSVEQDGTNYYPLLRQTENITLSYWNDDWWEFSRTVNDLVRERLLSELCRGAWKIELGDNIQVPVCLGEYVVVIVD